jgi:5-methylcytosine-specific restriction endonuclease McrA
MKNSDKTLVLNSDYKASSTVPIKKAIIDSIIGHEMPGEGVRVEKYYEDRFMKDSAGREHLIPAVVVSNQYIRRKKVSFSRKNVFIRDDCRCQYCGAYKQPFELTFDHVIPRVKWRKEKLSEKRGTPTQWGNIVTACRRCNKRKGQKTPEEVGLKLLRQPVVPDSSKFVIGISPWSNIPDEWVDYLPENYRKYHEQQAKSM